jgi:hypothetical protein
MPWATALLSIIWFRFIGFGKYVTFTVRTTYFPNLITDSTVSGQFDEL